MLSTAERSSLAGDLARLADGDRSAMDAAFAALHPLVLGFTRRLLDPVAAEDAAQDALVRLFERVSDYDATRDPVPWALAFASNACRTARRKAGRSREGAAGTALDTAPAAGRTPDAALFDAELQDAVRTTLGGLSPLDSETLQLALGERPNTPTFRKRLERATARFRAAWSS